MRLVPLVLSVLWLALGGCASTQALGLDQVVLHRNGIGYFELRGRLQGDRLRLRFRAHEIDDVLKTLAVVDRTGARYPITVRLPQTADEKGGRRAEVDLEVVLGAARRRDLVISYAVPTAAWKATYRVILPTPRSDQTSARATLQAWAMVDNVSAADWAKVDLKLDTGTPLSFATDLRTPRFVARPDASGQMVQPLAVGAVAADRALPGDSDGDGVPDRDDLCPNEPEDRDGFEDSDGCPDPDNDGDRIADKDDKCPNEPETYNGFEDEDGCPDKGQVVIHKGSTLPGETSGKLRQVIALRQKLASEEQRAEDLRSRLEDASSQNAEVRQSVVALAKSADATLKKRLLGRLKVSLEQTDRLARELGEATVRRTELRSQLRELMHGLRISDR